MGNNEISVIVDFLSSDFLWLCFAIIVLLFYGIIALLTWNFKKPLMFLGIPTTIAGIILILFMLAVNFLPIEEKLFDYILLMFKPLLTIGIVFFVVGLIMIIIYKLVNKKKQNALETNNI